MDVPLTNATNPEVLEKLTLAPGDPVFYYDSEDDKTFSGVVRWLGFLSGCKQVDGRTLLAGVELVLETHNEVFNFILNVYFFSSIHINYLYSQDKDIGRGDGHHGSLQLFSCALNRALIIPANKLQFGTYSIRIIFVLVD